MSAGPSSKLGGRLLPLPCTQETPEHLCYAVGSGAVMLELVTRARQRRAMPYHDLLFCEWRGEVGSAEAESLLVAFPGVEITVSGRGLGPVWEALREHRLQRLSVVKPERVFEADGTVVEEIEVTDL